MAGTRSTSGRSPRAHHAAGHGAPSDGVMRFAFDLRANTEAGDAELSARRG